MRPDLALTAINAVREHHAYGHTCHDGRWYNPNAGTRSPCPDLRHLDTAREQVERLHASVHEAAHTDRHAVAVAEGMTGLTMSALDPESREGWTLTARMAIEALAASLDGDDDLTARARAASARITT